MAMNGNAMGEEVAAAIMNMNAPPEVQAAVTELWKKICTAMVNHIKNNAQVPAGISVQTTGSATTQSGSTTAPGSVT